MHVCGLGLLLVPTFLVSTLCKIWNIFFCYIRYEMEWSAIETTYALKKSDERGGRDEVLTEQAKNVSFDEMSANYISDVMSDVAEVFSQSKSPIELLLSLITVLTKGDRGIIFGTILVIMSLALLALQPNKEVTVKSDA